MELLKTMNEAKAILKVEESTGKHKFHFKLKIQNYIHQTHGAKTEHVRLNNRTVVSYK